MVSLEAPEQPFVLYHERMTSLIDLGYWIESLKNGALVEGICFERLMTAGPAV